MLRYHESKVTIQGLWVYWRNTWGPLLHNKTGEGGDVDWAPQEGQGFSTLCTGVLQSSPVFQ